MDQQSWPARIVQLGGDIHTIRVFTRLCCCTPDAII